jgi:DNA (cytosine-5)-methyltransferase 1
MDKITNFKLAELFCGPGGLALGALNAEVFNGTEHFSIKPVWANDIDPYACTTYQKNIHPNNPSAVVCKRIEEIDLANITEFDALAFGFPCNDFSVVGEQKGINGKYGPLYSYGVKAINIHNPLWFIAENVNGLKSANGGLVFKMILNELENSGAGYKLTAHLYKFEDYGVPQYRHRIVIIGIRKDINLKFAVPAPTTYMEHISARQALENPPIKPDTPNNELTKQSRLVEKRLSFIPPGENAWYKGIPHDLRLRVKKAKMSQIYRRLNPDKPAYTITGSGGGGTHGYHWKENRALTNRERARLQTFPDSFIFEGSKESVRRQIGMAVPPAGVRVIFEAVLKTFADIPYKSVHENISDSILVNSKKTKSELYEVLQLI